MTKEGRYLTHLNEIKLGRKSPYAEEFAEPVKEVKKETKKNGK